MEGRMYSSPLSELQCDKSINIIIELEKYFSNRTNTYLLYSASDGSYPLLETEHYYLIKSIKFFWYLMNLLRQKFSRKFHRDICKIICQPMLENHFLIWHLISSNYNEIVYNFSIIEQINHKSC